MMPMLSSSCASSYTGHERVEGPSEQPLIADLFIDRVDSDYETETTPQQPCIEPEISRCEG